MIDFIKPSNLKELRSFLGLVNYFRDHIRDHSIVTHPLQAMIIAADKGPKVRFQGVSPSNSLYGLLKLKAASCR